MSESVISVEEAARCLPEVVDRVQATGKATLLLKSGEPIAQIVPVPSSKNGSADLVAFLRTWRKRHPEPDEQFAEALEESRRSIRRPHDPWQ